MVRKRLDHRKTVLQTDQITCLLQRKAGSPEVLIFTTAVNPGGIIQDVVMDVCPVCMCRNRKRVFSLRDRHRELISDPVCLLRGNLSRFKGLPDLVSNDVSSMKAFPFWIFLIVLPFGQKKLFRSGPGITGIR